LRIHQAERVQHILEHGLHLAQRRRGIEPGGPPRRPEDRRAGDGAEQKSSRGLGTLCNRLFSAGARCLNYRGLTRGDCCCAQERLPIILISLPEKSWSPGAVASAVAHGLTVARSRIHVLQECTMRESLTHPIGSAGPFEPAGSGSPLKPVRAGGKPEAQ
jgi:hypothetical protein